MDNKKLASDRGSRKLPNLAFGKEWALLELVTLGLNSASEQEMFAELISDQDLDWQELLKQATRHKITCLLAFYIITNNLSEVITLDLKQQLETILFFNRHKIKIYRSKAAEIIRALTKNKIKFVGTKGISLESTLYQGNGNRTLSDIDFMILPNDRKVVSEILADLGYQMGTFEPKTGTIKPHSREMMINYKLNPDHLPAHILLIDDVIVPFIEVDIANSLTWTLSPFQIPVEVALENIVYQPIPEIKDISLPSFAPQFQFIFTILHLFKEAWIELTLDMNGKDVSLSKFSDVVRIWSRHQNELQNEEFVKILEQFDLIQPVVWVLEHLDRTLQTNIISSLGLEGKVTEEWLSSAAPSGTKARLWRGTMRKRLFTQDRRQLFRQ
ncbi:nucleotidyltransferase family protein [Pleurocapsa sp. PCC 7319]|uniref:nucleotidyltransferase family protein n=1 Tax=Pleurocapsa sp. PCC 7319 TaxID=118161 RepID=UPI000348327C|nr:nucleotidyltransferase family protein [Pleurocapsa sp. PCC 7319]